MPGRIPSPRMADKIIESIYASEFVIDEAFVDASGSASRVNLTAALAVPAASAAAAQATADAAVPKTARVPLGFRVDLSDTATGSVVRLIPLFAGTLQSAAAVLDGDTTAVGSCSAAITIDGTPVVLAAPLSFAAASAAGTRVITTVASGGTFTANQTIEITTTSANTGKTFGGITLGASRA